MGGADFERLALVEQRFLVRTAVGACGVSPMSFAFGFGRRSGEKGDGLVGADDHVGSGPSVDDPHDGLSSGAYEPAGCV